MKELVEALTQFLETIAAEIRSGVPAVSGKTRDSVEVSVRTQGSGVFSRVRGEITANAYITTFETGRRPTPGFPEAGTPTLREAIEDWVEAKGIKFTQEIKRKDGSVKFKEMTKKQMSFIIASKIHREGNVLYRKLAGGVSGLLSRATDLQRVEAFVKVFGDRAGTVVLAEVLKLIPDIKTK